MSKNVIRLNESQLHKMIKECVKRILNEGKSTLYDFIVGSELIDNVLWEYVPEGCDPYEKIDEIRTQLNDPAIDEIYKTEYTIWAEYYYSPRNYYHDTEENFEITSDEGLEDTISKVKNDDVRGDLYKEYESMMDKLSFENNKTAEDQDYYDSMDRDDDWDY